MTYRAPVNDMLLALNHGAGLQAAVKAGHYGDFDGDIAAAVLEEAGKFASDVLAPLNRVGDEHGIKLEDDKVITAPLAADKTGVSASIASACLVQLHRDGQIHRGGPGMYMAERA